MFLTSSPMRSFRIAAWLTSFTLALTACGKLKSNHSELQYRAFGRSASFLTKQNISVCLVNEGGIDSSVIQRISNDIPMSIQEWVQPIQSFSSSVSTNVSVSTVATDTSCGVYDLLVRVKGLQGRAYVQGGVMHLFGSSEYGTVLHELGHIFGLADTYVEGQWRCERGQPSSAMCSHFETGGRLTSDDIEGIINRYCDLNPAACESQAAHRRKVILAFNDCLGRDPESDGVIAQWQAVLQTSGYNALKNGVCGSAEGKNHNVNKIYRTCLGRGPENSAVIEEWGNEVVQYGFAVTQEKVCALSEEGRSFNVAKMFQTCLGRNPENQTAVNNWGNYYYTYGYGATLTAICYSSEGLRFSVTSAYQTCLGRNPESQQVIDVWGAYYAKNGWSELKSAICNSTEALAR